MENKTTLTPEAADYIQADLMDALDLELEELECPLAGSPASLHHLQGFWSQELSRGASIAQAAALLADDNFRKINGWETNKMVLLCLIEDHAYAMQDLLD